MQNHHYKIVNKDSKTTMNFWEYGRKFYITKCKKSDFLVQVKREKTKGKKHLIYNLPEYAKIEKLRKLSKVKKISNLDFITRRQVFDNIKHKLFERWKICSVCRKNKVENIHHIIMLSNGGNNEKSNLIGICKNCHKKIHDWM